MRVSCFHYVHEKHISKCAFICVPEKKILTMIFCRKILSLSVCLILLKMASYFLPDRKCAAICRELWKNL